MEFQLDRREVGDLDGGAESRQVERKSTRTGADFEDVIAALYESLEELAMYFVGHATTR
jgi:hypothetical protein